MLVNVRWKKEAYPTNWWKHRGWFNLIYKVTCGVRPSDATFRGRIGLCLGESDTTIFHLIRPFDRAFRPVNGLYHADSVCPSPETQVLRAMSWEKSNNSSMREKK
jgi:hypothetical protein